MRFEKGDGVWHLIDENAPKDACVIATLHSEAEALALKRFCELFAQDPAGVPAEFGVWHDDKWYKVSLVGGDKLALRMVSEDSSVTLIETQFAFKPPHTAS